MTLRLPGQVALLPTTLVMLLAGCKDEMSPTDEDLAGATVDLSGGGVLDLRGADGDLRSATDLTTVPPTMSFFITSRTGSANLGGLAGADQICQQLAAAQGSKRRWAAYLSAYAANGVAAVNARDRIGKGPWYSAKLDLVAKDLADLHDQMKMDTVSKATGLDEKGAAVPGRDTSPNQHDVLTGSTLTGEVNAMSTCGNWTSEVASGMVASVGHFDRGGGGTNPASWNFAHNSSGCSAAALVSTGGAGRLYCFATD